MSTPAPQEAVETRDIDEARRVLPQVSPDTPTGAVHLLAVPSQTLRPTICQRLDAVHDLAQRSVAWARVGDALLRPPGRPLDAEAEQVEAVLRH